MAIADGIADVAIVIVGYRNAADINECLAALARTSGSASFDIFICENGGAAAYADLLRELTAADGVCTPADRSGGAESPSELQGSRLTEIRRLRLRTRASDVWIGCARDNLGYAGGINVWLDRLRHLPGWKGVWILNPDTEPEPDALTALIERAEAGGKGLVGSTILEAGEPAHIRFRGGLHWQRFKARGIAVGLGDRRDAPCHLPAIEAALDCPSGSSMYATRSCIERIGPLDERYFLFFEDLDWGVRAKASGLGYANKSVVLHKRGTTTGTAKAPAAIPRLSVYLEHRNGIHFVRRHFPWSLPIRISVSLLYAIRFLVNGAPRNCVAALEGVLAGLRGETGRPAWHRELSGDTQAG